nr:hypothetical protein Itr_chr05CG25380 [Ipomoea trifida]
MGNLEEMEKANDVWMIYRGQEGERRVKAIVKVGSEVGEADLLQRHHLAAPFVLCFPHLRSRSAAQSTQNFVLSDASKLRLHAIPRLCLLLTTLLTGKHTDTVLQHNLIRCLTC